VTEFVAEFEPFPVLTVASVPSGLRVLVDGEAFATPAQFRWEPGSWHVVEYEREQVIGNSRYRLDRLRSQAVALAGRITGPPFDTSMTAAFAVDHRVRVSAAPDAGGKVTLQPASAGGFYEAEQRVRLVASPNPGFVFKGWRPETLGAESAVDVSVAAPLEAVAEFEPAVTVQQYRR
jgi:hypothetical protein